MHVAVPVQAACAHAVLEKAPLAKDVSAKERVLLPGLDVAEADDALVGFLSHVLVLGLLSSILILLGFDRNAGVTFQIVVFARHQFYSEIEQPLLEHEAEESAVIQRQHNCQARELVKPQARCGHLPF